MEGHGGGVMIDTARSWMALMMALAVGILTVSGPLSARAETRCFGDWSEAEPVVRRERLKTARDVLELAREQFGGDVVRIMLCKEDSGFAYRLVLRWADGRIGNMRLSALP